MALYFDPADPSIKQRLQALPPTKGYCIFVDIVGSTSLKNRSIWEWASSFHNTFVNTACFLPTQAQPLKIIGDCSVFFIRETDLEKMMVSPLWMLRAMWKLAYAGEPSYRDVRMSVVYCHHAYELTFTRGTADVYGRDIDLASRLLEFAGPQEIVMNEEFVKRVRFFYSRMEDKQSWALVQGIVGPRSQRIKGFADLVPMYKLPAKLPC